jgi:hypothetical protein
MTSKKQKKGKTMALTDFLNADSKLVTVRATNWSEIVDSEEAETKPIGKKIQLNKIYIFSLLFSSC